VNAAGIGEAMARARDFALAHGDPLQRARARATLDPDLRGEVERALGAIDAPVTAVAALEVLDALGVRDGAAVERAVSVLAAAQQPDGSWAADPDEAGVVATAAIAGLLAKTHCVRAGVLERAAHWLEERYARERIEAGGADALVAWAQFFANAAHERGDEGLQWCGRALERGFRSGALDAVAASRVFLRCDAPALPGARLGATDVALGLLAAQAGDGGFGRPGADPGARVEATLDALAALCRLTPRVAR
jgi:hypothetical protein